MNVESTEIVWLTAKEVEIAIRAMVRAEGFHVTSHAQVSGLAKLSMAPNAVSVRVEHSIREVKS